LDLTPENDPGLSSRILSELGLVFSEMSFTIPGEGTYLLGQAHLAWEAAEKKEPGSTLYAQARWAAWENHEDLLRKSLVHEAIDEDLFIWPPFAMALQEPAFRAYREKPWFKATWFGYQR
jgi:hypothetical protein